MLVSRGFQSWHPENFVAARVTLPSHVGRRFVRGDGAASVRLPWNDCDLDCGSRTYMVAIFSMMFGVPMPNSSLDFIDKVEAALLSQMSEIADQVCNGMFISGRTVPLKNLNGLGGPRNVVGFIPHARPSTWRDRVLLITSPRFGNGHKPRAAESHEFGECLLARRRSQPP